MTSIVEVIRYYQRSIDSNQDNEARLLHCINKLYKLPIKVEHLQETGVGKTVNSLRKYNGEIGVAAKTLVTKWKAMVAAEEEPMDTSSQNNENETPYNDGGATPHEEEDDINHNRSNTTIEQQVHNSKHNSGNQKDKHKDRHKDRSSSSSVHKDTKTSSSHNHSSDKSSRHKTMTFSSAKDSEIQHKDNSSSGCSIKNKEREKEKAEHKSRREKNKDREDEHSKEKERSDKKREEKSKSEKEQKNESTSATNSSSHHKSKSHSHHKSSSKSKHEDKHSHSSSKEKERSDKHRSSSKDKGRSKDEMSSQTTSKDKHEHKASTSSTSKSSTKDYESSERKRRQNSENDSIEFKPPQPKMPRVPKPSKLESSSPQEDEGAEDSFDSSMGANFDDVLGMLNMPKKKGKKTVKSPTTPMNNSSSSNKKEVTAHRMTVNVVNGSGGNVDDKLNGSRTTSNFNSYTTPSTSKVNTTKPDLLAPSAKLEPLDPSIALELPTISTNYKPLPLNQTVMDCVFNNSANSKPVRTLSDAEAITHGISSKTIRTKIYSGIKTGQTYQVPTLFDMCIRILQKNIDALEYTGGVPFEVLRPVLERATTQQLYVFEEYNPYLMEDSDVLWQQHVSRNFRTKKRLENESWREMFIRCQEEEEQRLSILKDSIKASQKIAAAPFRKTQLAFVDSMVKPPRNILKKQEQYGTQSKLVATPAARVASLSSVTPNAAKTGDQRLKVSTTVRDHAQVSTSSIRRKKAPLMQKTLQFIRGRHKR